MSRLLFMASCSASFIAIFLAMRAGVAHMEIIIIIIWAVLWGFLCALIAANKGRSMPGWFILGALFSFFALIFILAAPDLNKQSKLQEISEKYDEAVHAKRLLELQLAGGNGSGSKTCPFCAETIKAEAIVCRFCNRDLPAQNAKVGAEGRTTGGVDLD